MKTTGKIILGAVVIILTTSGRCSSSTKIVEKIVNKSTQMTKKKVNKEFQEMKEQLQELTENPNVRRGAAYGAYRMSNDAARSNAQTSSHPRMVTCPGCMGVGKRKGADGIIYIHTQCNGTGKIWIK